MFVGLISLINAYTIAYTRYHLGMIKKRQIVFFSLFLSRRRYLIFWKWL